MIDTQSPEFIRGLVALRQECRKALEQAYFPLKEYHLIKTLEQAGAYAFCVSAAPALQLFYKHFLTMHCLYALQPYFVVKKQYLNVSPLGIAVYSLDEVAQGQALSDESGALRSYYLDLTHLEHATEDSVHQLMRSFWDRFNAADALQEACNTLNVQTTDEWGHIERQYRKAIAEAHPDKGGRAEDFIALRQAFEVVRKAKAPG